MSSFTQTSPAVQASVDRLYDQFSASYGPTMGVEQLSQLLDTTPAAIRKRAWHGRLPASIPMMKPLRWSTLNVVLWLQGVEAGGVTETSHRSDNLPVSKRGPGRPRKTATSSVGGTR